MKGCVLITGCSSGIGRATATYFQQQGWNVVATMRNPQVEHELNSMPNVLIEALDVTSIGSIQNAVANALYHFGKIDVLVNNAGIGALSVFEETGEALIRESFETNVFGVMRVTQALLPHFRANQSGTIINVTSTIPQVGAPLATLYCATKKAVEGFSQALYYELLPLGIRVKIVQPGSTRTHIAMQREAPGLPHNEVYQPICNEVVRGMRHRFETEAIAAPEGPAKTIYQAATDNSRHFHYVSGRDAKMVNVLIKLFPEQVLNMLVCRMFGLRDLLPSASAATR